MQKEGMMLYLSDIQPGHRARIRHLHGDPDARKRLRELGIFENAVVHCVHNRRGMMICKVLRSRVGLPATVSRTILVSYLDEA